MLDGARAFVEQHDPILIQAMRRLFNHPCDSRWWHHAKCPHLSTAERAALDAFFDSWGLLDTRPIGCYRPRQTSRRSR